MALALFDLDNTLLNGDSDHAWGIFLTEIGIVDADEHQRAQDKYYQQYVEGILDINEFLEFQLTPLKENSIEELNNWLDQFMQQKANAMIDEPKRELIEKHRQKGDDLLIITATNDFITRPIADALGISTLIATKAEKNEHGFTGKVEGTPCFQEGKIVCLEQWMKENNKNLEGSWFYSDSHNDLPLLKQVDFPVAVKPDEKLRAHAEQHNWQIISD